MRKKNTPLTPLISIQKKITEFFCLKIKLVLLLFFFSTYSNAQLYGDFPYSESFTSGVQPADISLLAPQGATLNAATFTPQGVQLTPALNNQFGAIYVATKQFTSSNGIKIEFEYGMYGGSGADGISMFLFDASIASPVIGANGGALGYSYNRACDTFAASRQTGLTGAYLGIGLDGFTNFKRNVFSFNLRNNGVPNTTFTQPQSHVTLRGAKGNVINAGIGLGDGYTGYPTLATQTTFATAVGSATIDPATGAYLTGGGLADNFNLRTPTLSWNPNNSNYRKCFVELIPHPVNGFYVTVRIQHGNIISTVINNYWYTTSYTYIENANPAVTDYNATNVLGANTSHVLSTLAPASFRVGFGASTGGLNDVHLIRNLKVTIPYAAEGLPDALTYCSNGGSVITVNPLLNDVAYDGPISGPPTASSANVDPNSFQFLDTLGNPQGQNYFIAGVGTWVYDPLTSLVNFTPVAGYNSVATVNYNIKGLSAPYNDEGYRSDPVTITASPILCSADVITTKIDGQTEYTPGTTVVYTITVTNNGPSDAVDVNVIDTAPAGTSITSWSATNGTSGTGNINEIIASIVNGATVTYTVNLAVPSNYTGNLTNMVAVTSASPDPDPSCANCSDTDTESILADVAVTKTVDNPTPNVGDLVTFTIIATNNGPSDETGVGVYEAIPSGYTVNSVTPSVGVWNDPEWLIGDLANGASATLTITAYVNASGDYLNYVEIDGDHGDDNDANDEDSETVTPTAVADLSITKVVDNATPNVGDTVTFTITATNNGPSDATNVVVTENIPSGYTVVSVTPSVGTWTAPTWTIGNLTNGTSQTLIVVATVNASGVYANTASVDGNENDPDPTDDSDTENVTPTAVADLSVTKVVNNATPNVGEVVTFTITATNNGPSDATNVVVTDVIPSGYTIALPTDIVPSTGTWTAPNWTIGNLANGASATLTITATVNPTGPYDNTATIDGNENDPDPSDDSDTEVVTPNNYTYAIDDINTSLINTPVTGNVLTNDFDLEGNTQTIASNTNPSNGTVVMNPDGTYTYTPNSGFTGTDSFTYTVCDNGTPIACSTATVTINVEEILISSGNNDLAANNDAVITENGTTITIAVLSNDFDPDNNTFVITPGSVTDPAN